MCDCLGHVGKPEMFSKDSSKAGDACMAERAVHPANGCILDCIRDYDFRSVQFIGLMVNLGNISNVKDKEGFIFLDCLLKFIILLLV